MKKTALKGVSVIELLIALLVVGIITAVTIPKFITKVKSPISNNKASTTQSIEYTAKWKSAYSNINQAGQMILANNGQTFSGLCSTNGCLKDAFKQYLSSLSECSDDVVNKCWHDKNSWKYLNGANVPTTFGDASGLMLMDGSFVVFAGADPSCQHSVCGSIYVDINGFQPPNTIGLDIFLLNITNNAIRPHGDGTISHDCIEGSTDSSNTGFTCAAKYISY